MNPPRSRLLLIFAWIFLLNHSATAEKKYVITDVFIQARLLADGSMQVTESRTYKFLDGTFRYAFQTLPRSEQVSFENFRVIEDDVPYQLADTEAPGTYRITIQENVIEVQWFFRAKNESRTFDMQYSVNNAVLVYEDAAVLYYQFIGKNWTRRQDNIELQIQPPQAFSKSSLNAWLHGPLWAESRNETDGSITAWCERLPKRSYLEIRAMYPLELFPDARHNPESVRDAIMAEEAQWVEEANQRRLDAIRDEEERVKRWAMGRWLLAGFCAAGFIGWWMLFNRYGRRPTLPESVRFASDIPEEISPALLSYLLFDRQIAGGGLVGTLFQQAKQGILILREEQQEKPGVFGSTRKKTAYIWELNRRTWEEKRSDLAVFENDLIAFLFDNLAEGEDRIDVKHIQKKQGKFIKFFQHWKKDVKKAGESHAWWDKESITAYWVSFAIFATMLLMIIPGAIFFGHWGLIPGGYALIHLFLTFTIPHRTQEGERLARHWKALKRYLKKYHYQTEDRTVVLDRLNNYFIYGLVLGVPNKIYKELAGFIPSENYHHVLPWYVYHGAGTGTFSPEAFATSFSAMITTTTSAMSSASGAGGGASGGGGGGAGGGGGGAG